MNNQLSAETAYTILSLIASAGTIYDEILTNILQKNVGQKNELISEIAVSFLSNQDKVNQALAGGYFNYYFINTVKNQVKSQTSPFHKNCRTMPDVELSYAMTQENDESDLEYKMLNEKQNDVLNEVLNGCKATWFEHTLFKMYYEDGMTYREIERETGVDHSLVFVTIKRVKERIKKQIDEFNI